MLFNTFHSCCCCRSCVKLSALFIKKTLSVTHTCMENKLIDSHFLSFFIFVEQLKVIEKRVNSRKVGCKIVDVVEIIVGVVLFGDLLKVDD